MKNEIFFNSLNGNYYSPTEEIDRKSSLIDLIEIEEVTKLPDKIKWNDRFLKSYTGRVRKINNDGLLRSKIFVATYQGKELGYTRVFDMSKYFSVFYGEKVSRITESYVKPPYRNQGVVSALRRYVVKHEQVRTLRIETNRFLRNKAYFESEGFFFAYSICDEMCIICTRDFFEPLAWYNKEMSARLFKSNYS